MKEHWPGEGKTYYTSLEEMYLANYKLVNAFIRDYYSDEETLRDTAQVVWLKVAEHFDRFERMDTVWIKNYLRIMVRNTVTDQLRQKMAADKAWAEAARTSLSCHREDIETQIFSYKREQYLSQAFETLSYDDKLLIYMRYNKKMTSEEIGRVLGITDSAVRMRQARLLKRLRIEIAKMSDNDDGDI